MREEDKAEPEQEDTDAIERDYGPLPPNASAEERAERYWLWVAQAIVREYQQQQELNNNRPAS